jgi:Ser/Thr protein kinase RdoA (MazF antagonist)
VKHGANAVYEFQTANARLFLRVTPDRHRNRIQVEAELDFVDFVASRGVCAARALPSDSGAVVETVEGSGGELWHAVAFAAAPGRHFQFFTRDIDRPLFRAWGLAMGALHSASRHFTPVPGRQRLSWSEFDTTRCDVTMLPPLESAARREHARVTEWLATRVSTPASWGLIHGDFERTNFVLDGTTLRVYDFDDACYHWYLADVAHALWAFRGAPADDRRRFLAWFLEGYREWCSVDDNVRDELSWLVRLRSLSLFVHRLYTSAAPVLNRQWGRRMRAAFDEPFSW